MEEIKKKEIINQLVDSEVLVEGGESKFTVHVKSDSFLGKTIIEQHKMIYAIFQHVKFIHLMGSNVYVAEY